MTVIDLTSGTRTAAANETIRYSTDWVSGATANAVAVVAVDGVQLSATAANGRPVWECYVAGTDPTNVASIFTAAIAISNDVPHITWSPNLNTNGIVRKYTILGKESLTDTADWAPTNSTHSFFKVKVEMP